MFSFWKFLHIASMFSALVFLDGPELVAWRAVRRRDVRTIRTVRSMGKLHDALGIGSLALGVIFGLLAASAGGIDFFAPWLITAYVLLALTIVIAGVVGGVVLGRIEEAARASDDDTPSPELERLISRPGLRLLYLSGPVLMVAIIYVMVTKPFS